MSVLASLKELAIESGLGRASYAASQVWRARNEADPYRKAAGLLRAWRSSDQSWVTAPAWRFLQDSLTSGGQPVPLERNPLLQSFVADPLAAGLRRGASERTLNDRVRMRLPRPSESETRQGSLMVLKARDDSAGEKGVLMIKYSEAIEALPALFDIERLVRHYAIVLEPSWWGYQDAALFNYAGAGADVVVQAQARDDYAFLRDYGMGLVPIRIGAGDWIDPAFFLPGTGVRRFDVVMVSSWNPFKRHTDLFAAMKKARASSGRKLSAALIGYPNGWTADDIAREVRRYGLEDQCEIFNAIPQAQVAEIVAESRAYVLLSRREGANKAMYEAMFCNTPVVAPFEHRGINHDHLNDQTGMTFRRGRLAEALIQVVDTSARFQPRAWAEANTGYVNATRKLDGVLQTITVERGGVWRTGIVEKKNQPNLTYAHERDRLALVGEYGRLEEFLRPA